MSGPICLHRSCCSPWTGPMAQHATTFWASRSGEPGFKNLQTGVVATSDWLPESPVIRRSARRGSAGFPFANEAPIQKFMWWDARLDGSSAGDTLGYEVTPVCGTKTNHALVPAAASSVTIALPPHVEMDIGTWFNRAVMSSQAFSAQVHRPWGCRVASSPLPHRRRSCAPGSPTAWRSRSSFIRSTADADLDDRRHSTISLTNSGSFLRSRVAWTPTRSAWSTTPRSRRMKTAIRNRTRIRRQSTLSTR